MVRVIKIFEGLPNVYGGESRGLVTKTPNFSRGEVRGLQFNEKYEIAANHA